MKYLLPLLLLAILAGCDAKTAQEPRADKLAKSLCQCTSELLLLNKKAQSTTDSLTFKQIEQAFEKAKTCAVGLGIKPEEQPVLETALQAYCPELAAYPELIKELTVQ
ncbi:MAG: hypothetical protein JNN28_16560 [Saprospiraceae bacterium]|nr:hypothetical protein [Saprospiraceae bacterium]